MKVAAIYNVFDGVELLIGSMKCLANHVDVFIIVHQNVSNFGEVYNGFNDLDLSAFQPVLISYIPKEFTGFKNEKLKRNIGIERAKELNCTHFIMMDCDEYYQDFGKAKQQYMDSGIAGSVCQLYTYIGAPTIRCEKPDGYYVPFIHKLYPNSQTGYSHYPFHVDPTRKINETGVVIIEEKMDHFSWVRKNIDMKINNSSARQNIYNGKIAEDYKRLIELTPEKIDGFYVRDWDAKLIQVPNQYGITTGC